MWAAPERLRVWPDLHHLVVRRGRSRSAVPATNGSPSPVIRRRPTTSPRSLRDTARTAPRPRTDCRGARPPGPSSRSTHRPGFAPPSARGSRSTTRPRPAAPQRPAEPAGLDVDRRVSSLVERHLRRVLGLHLRRRGGGSRLGRARHGRSVNFTTGHAVGRHGGDMPTRRWVLRANRGSRR